MHLVPKPGATTTPAEIFRVLAGAGVRGDAVTVEASGEVRAKGFHLPGAAEPYAVLSDPVPSAGPAKLRFRVRPRRPADNVEAIP